MKLSNSKGCGLIYKEKYDTMEVQMITMKDVENTMRMLEKSEERKIPYLYFNSDHIKSGLEIGFLEDRDGFVSYGGLKVMDSTKGERAVTKDYID